MKTIHIKDKLKELGYSLEDINLGDFDFIGEYTAKKNRERSNPLFKTAGCFFRPNYERGILLHHLVKRFEAKRVLEVGFGRGYGAFCIAKSMCDAGFLDAKVFSLDPNIDQNHLKAITSVFPKEWFEKLFLMQGTFEQALPSIKDEKFDIIYIDGDHRKDAVLSDWLNAKERFTKYVIFDDYDAIADEGQIQVHSVVDGIDGYDKELIVMDRRIFQDDRRLSDEQITYGQVMVKHPDFNPSDFMSEW